MDVLIVPAVVGIVVLVVVARSLVIVPPNTAYVIEKLGRAARVLHPGLHVVTPFVGRIAARVPLGDQTLEIHAVSNALRSGGEASARGTVTIRVVDAMRAVTDVADYRAALATLVATRWKQAIAESDSVNAVTAVRATETAIQEAAAEWGLTLIEMRPSIQLSADAEQMLMAKAEEEQEKRILAWLATRGERPGRDGRPTDAQWEAYQAWIDHELAAHSDEIAGAKRLAEEAKN